MVRKIYKLCLSYYKIYKNSIIFDKSEYEPCFYDFSYQTFTSLRLLLKFAV